MITWLLALCLSCSPAPTPISAPGAAVPRATAPQAAAPQAPAAVPMVDQHQQHPPLPADNPAWDWEAGGFVPDFGWYGEHSWDDVRMRVAGHIATAGRDLARSRAQVGDFAGCATAYDQLHQQLLTVKEPTDPGVAKDIRSLLIQASSRDAALCQALASGQAPTSTGSGLAPLRTRLLGLALRQAAGEYITDPLTRLQADLLPYLADRPDLDLDTFRDFDDRHKLRVALFDAYLDGVEPLAVDHAWGYWEPAEIARSALLLGLTAQALGGADWTPKAVGRLAGDVPAAVAAVAHSGASPLLWSGMLAQRLPLADQIPAFTVDGLGHLPTGDSLIDVGAEPGPRAIGTLERLGLDDPSHHQWLEAQATLLNPALSNDPPQVVKIINKMSARIDAMGHGSRYYNIKQLHNDAVRQLARVGQPALARRVLEQSWPLHAQDWACPNRQGILETLDGRLMLAESNQPGSLVTVDQAQAKLRSAVQEGLDFLALTEAAERGEDVGQRPPGAGARGGPGPQGPPLPPSRAQQQGSR